MPPGDEVLGHRLSDFLMGETDEHVDRSRSEVPHFHDRDVRRDKATAALGGMRNAGEEYAVGAPAENGGEKAFFAGRWVTRCAEQHLVAALPQSIGQGLDGLGENLVRDRRYDRGHESGSAGRKPSGQQIRNVPGALDHPAHMFQRAGGHHFRLIEHARDGNRRNARQFGHIPQCEDAGRSTYGRTSTKGCGPMLHPSIMITIS